MSTNEKTQWHMMFADSIHQDLKRGNPTVELDGAIEEAVEVALPKLPLKADYLSLQKDETITLTDTIGRFFRKYNFGEFKGPDEYDLPGRVPCRDCTLTVVVRKMPDSFEQQMEAEGISVQSNSDGTYWLKDAGAHSIPTQIVVTSELNEEEYPWLSSLSRDVTLEKAKRLAELVDEEQDADERDAARALLDRILDANPKAQAAMEAEAKENKMGLRAVGDVLFPEYKNEIDTLRNQVIEMTDRMSAKDKELEARDRALEARDREVEALKKENDRLRREGVARSKVSL